MQPKSQPQDPDILVLLDEIQTIARNGLAFTKDPYDRERYEKLIELATHKYEQILNISSDILRKRFVAELGYITPKVGSDAAIFDSEGRILLMRRSDNRKWCLPCGWLDPGESPDQAALREIREETGLEAEVIQLVRIFGTPAGSVYGPHGAVTLVYLCRVTGGELSLSHEGMELGYHRIEDVSDWHSRHHEYAVAANAVWKQLTDHSITAADFQKVKMQVGKIVRAEPFPKTKKPAYKLWIDFGDGGIKTSSAQLTALYRCEELPEKWIIAVTNFPPKNIAGFLSEVLVLGVELKKGEIVLLTPERDVPLGGTVF
jgi:export-related chaperone CsaA